MAGYYGGETLKLEKLYLKQTNTGNHPLHVAATEALKGTV